MNIHWKDWCWSWSSNTLAIWCRADWLEKTLILKKRPWRQKKRAAEDETVRCITDSMDMNLSKHWEIVEDRGAWCTAVPGVVKSQTRLLISITVTLGLIKNNKIPAFYLVLNRNYMSLIQHFYSFSLIPLMIIWNVFCLS